MQDKPVLGGSKPQNRHFLYEVMNKEQNATAVPGSIQALKNPFSPLLRLTAAVIDLKTMSPTRTVRF